MARKSWMYAVLEAVQHEMRKSKDMVWMFELTPPVASNPGKPVINLEKEFGRGRVNNTGIDEMWMASATLGSALAGSKAATYIPYQGNCMCFQMHAEPRRQAPAHDRRQGDDAGGVHDGDDRPDARASPGQHSDYEIDTYYAHIPGAEDGHSVHAL